MCRTPSNGGTPARWRAARRWLELRPTPIGALAVCGTSGTVLLVDGAGDPLSPGLM